MRLVVVWALRLAGAGIAAGILCALAGGRILSSLLYQVSPTDFATLVLAAAILLGVLVIASALPARRAARVDPVIALRAE